jgi:hypothetical protein
MKENQDELFQNIGLENLINDNINRNSIITKYKEVSKENLQYKKLEKFVRDNYNKKWDKNTEKWIEVSNDGQEEKEKDRKKSVKNKKGESEIDKKMDTIIKLLKTNIDNCRDMKQYNESNFSKIPYFQSEEGVITFNEFIEFRKSKSMKLAASVNIDLYKKVEKYIMERYGTSDSQSQIIETAFLEILYKNSKPLNEK